MGNALGEQDDLAGALTLSEGAKKTRKIRTSEWISSRLLVDYSIPFSFEGRPYLKKIHDLNDRKVMFRTGRQVEKSLNKNSTITMADGSRKKAIDIKVGDEVATLDIGTGKMTVSKVTWKSEVYRKPCRRVVTGFGNVAEMALTHPVRQLERWTETGDLAVGDRVCCVRRTGKFGSLEVAEERVALTAMLIAEGTIGTKARENVILFTQGDGPVMDEFIKQAGRAGASLRVSGGCVSIHKGVIQGWMVEDGLLGTKSATKFIPGWVFELGREKAALFLNRLWAGDGHVKKNGESKYSLEYCSMSEGLVRQVQALMWKFGIPSSVRKNWPSIYKKRGEEKFAWILRVVTADGVRRFLGEIGALGKSEGVEFPSAEENNNRDTLPMEIAEIIRESTPCMKGSNLENWQGGSGRSLYGEGLRRSPKYPLSRRKAGEYIKFMEEEDCDPEGIRKIRAAASDDILWDKIKCIEEIGEQDCVDFTVEGTGNFVCEGIITHNSSTLSAKIVAKCCMVPQSKALYVSPSQGQSRVFSHARLERVMASPFIRGRYFDPIRCLTGDAKVLLANGNQIEMEQIVGDRLVGLEVVTYSRVIGGFRTGNITAVHMNGKRTVGRLKLEGGESLVCTADHRIWTQRGWRKAAAIAADRRPQRYWKLVGLGPGRGKAWAEVVGWEEIGEAETFDISVSNDRCFVANGVIVHNCINHVFEKHFLNGSTTMLQYASTDANRVRGMSATDLFMDEIQDMNHDIFPVVEETITHCEYPYQVYAGTPKTFNNAMETHWKKSTQCEWLIKCTCGEWVYQDKSIVRKAGPTCPKCEKILNPEFGRWVPMKERDAEFLGFRIPQTMVPWIYRLEHKWAELYKKSIDWPDQQFFNEVMGLAHEKGANPVTESDMQKCCGKRENKDFYDRSLYYPFLVAGVDWGAGINSYTVLTVVGVHAGRTHLLYVKKFIKEKDEPDVQVAEIARTVQRFGCQMIACDWGLGYVQNKQLQQLLLGSCDVIQLCESSTTKKRDVSYAKKGHMYTFNRQIGLSLVFRMIKQQEYEFPAWQYMQPFVEDFTCIFQDYRPHLRCIVYDHPNDMPDDTCHSLMFATLCQRIATGERMIN